VKQWVTFDLDNTLIKSPFARLHFLPWLRDQAQKHGLDYDLLWAQIQRQAESKWRRGDWVQSFDWNTIVQEVGLDKLPEPPQPSAAALRPLLLPHVNWMLREIRRLPVSLALVTNGFYAFQAPYLRSLGWDYVFDAVITPDRTGYTKPHPLTFVEVTPGLVHVGDRLSHDVLAARRTGRIAVQAGYLRPERDRIDPLSPARIVPDFALDDYRQLPTIIDQLLHRTTTPHL
jgi:FMN phosphatase YigB (HAD superfamily)